LSTISTKQTQLDISTFKMFRIGAGLSCCLDHSSVLQIWKWKYTSVGRVDCVSSVLLM